MNSISVPSIARQRWSHWMAGASACAIFPLIWVGGLVTTYDAGMAVPDWPGTYGDHLWWYSWSKWLTGPWDLFIEHGHRLLGSLVGMFALAFVAIAWWPTAVASLAMRRNRWLSLALFVAVLSQGVLGGMRVLLVERDLARLHGIFGPLVFTFACTVWACTSSAWRETGTFDSADGSNSSALTRRIWVRWAWMSVVVIAGQIVLGACMRHLPLTLTPGSFRALVLAHVAVGLLATWCLAWLAWNARSCFVASGSAANPPDSSQRVASQPVANRPISSQLVTRTIYRSVTLVALQIGLGIATWVVKYSWPAILAWVPGSESYVVQADGWLPSTIVTAHVAVGSLILANTAVAALWGTRLSGCCCVPSVDGSRDTHGLGMVRHQREVPA